MVKIVRKPCIFNYSFNCDLKNYIGFYSARVEYEDSFNSFLAMLPPSTQKALDYYLQNFERNFIEFKVL